MGRVDQCGVQGRSVQHHTPSNEFLCGKEGPKGQDYLSKCVQFIEACLAQDISDACVYAFLQPLLVCSYKLGNASLKYLVASCSVYVPAMA